MFGNKSAGLRGIVNVQRLSRREKRKRDALATWRAATVSEALDRAASFRETYFALVRPIRGLQ
jgi:hypothetical protein